MTLLNDYNLPIDTNFEIYKPISYVCNGIDPYDQGQGLAFDYTLNLTFGYNNQNTLNKILYLMASKYLISQSDYQQRVDNNQDIAGYFYLADQTSTDTSSYSVSSIDEFRLFGYAGYIPDLKDGVVRPILTKAFSPKDSSKYTYDEYVQLLISEGITNQDDINDKVQEYLDAGNTFYTINNNTQSDSFVSLKQLSVCATNYNLNTPKYWNLPNNNINKFNSSVSSDQSGFINLYSVINSGKVYGSTSPPYTITNIPVGYNCQVISVTINSLGSNQTPGTYQSWVAPSSNIITTEQPALIQYTILSSGVLNPSSINILNPGANFSFNFSSNLLAPGFSTSIGTSYANVMMVMDNLAYFNIQVDGSNNVTSMTQTGYPALGYNAGFVFNKYSLYGLGYTATTNINILIANYPTVDSFIIANSNTVVGNLENLSNFQNPSTAFPNINYTNGTQYYTLFETEIFNSISIPSSYGARKISYISLNCKLIELNNINPSGYILANIYSDGVDGKTKVAVSDVIDASKINKKSYDTLNIPINYLFTNFEQKSSNVIYWISIEQHLRGGFLSIQGSFSGITTSNYSIFSSQIYNDPNNIVVFGGISTNNFDLDLSYAVIGISSIFGSNIISGITSSAVINLRRDESYNGVNNSVALSVSTTYNSITDVILSNPISIIGLSTIYNGIGFTFNTLIQPTTIINSSTLVFSNRLNTNQVYLSRSMSQYDVSQVGLATSSQVAIGGTTVNFNFFFNKLFNEINPYIYAGFNYTNDAQFGLAMPNTLRTESPVNTVNGWWAFSSVGINTPVSIYPRAFLSNSSVIGTSLPTYKYLSYTHNIYANIGYNSNGIYKQELITLLASPKWKATWMNRSITDYKNFSIYNVVQQTYIDSIDYHIGSALTNIGISTGPKSCIFEGTFTPTGNLSLPVPITIGLGTSSGVQMYLNGGTQPVIDTFSVISLGNTTVTGFLTTSTRDTSVSFKILYYTLSTASIQVYWSIGAGNTLINSYTSLNSTSSSPISLNSGLPIDQIVFFNVSKTQSDATSVNSGFPPGDSFIIRSS